MKFTKQAHPVKDLVAAWRNGSIIRNPEYQRGAAWSLSQKQALVDSLFRHYPIPPLFLERKVSRGLGGSESEKFEVIDGQQRLLALADYFSDNFELLPPTNKKLRLPISLRGMAAPWSERCYSALDSALKEHLDALGVDVYVISEEAHPDEVRDLFIRLQSGTALSRQQVRDAWPGNIGPFIEALAGKLARRPRYGFFRLVDGRGLRDDDGDSADDPYVKDRQTCAQLLRLLLARTTDPLHFPSITAADLDGLYHEYTDLDTAGPLASSILNVFDTVEQVDREICRINNRRCKISKLGLFALCLFLQDAFRNPHFKMNRSAITEAAAYVTGGAPRSSGGTSRKSTSGPAIRTYYEEWREAMPQTLGIKTDPQRCFSAQQKQELFQLADGKCALCGKPVALEDAEGDHYPIPYRDGGPTTTENGRLVCKTCHPRGRPTLE